MSQPGLLATTEPGQNASEENERADDESVLFDAVRLCLFDGVRQASQPFSSAPLDANSAPVGDTV